MTSVSELRALILEQAKSLGKDVKAVRSRIASMNEAQLKVELTSMISNSEVISEKFEGNVFGAGFLADDSMGLGIERTTPQIIAETDIKPTTTAQDSSYSTSMMDDMTEEEIKDHTIDSIVENIDEGKKLYWTQMNNQGIVSDGVNNFKEMFANEFAGSRVYRDIRTEEVGADLTQLAKDGVLDEKTYLETKLDLAIEHLTTIEQKDEDRKYLNATLSIFNKSLQITDEDGAYTKEAIAYLRSELSQLTPEELNSFITNLRSMSDDDFNDNIHSNNENLIKNAIQRKETENSPKISERSFNFIPIN